MSKALLISATLVSVLLISLLLSARPVSSGNVDSDTMVLEDGMGISTNPVSPEDIENEGGGDGPVFGEPVEVEP